jgi:hypothetical protein
MLPSSASVPQSIRHIGVRIDTSRYGRYACFLREDLQAAAAELAFAKSAAGYQQLRQRVEQIGRLGAVPAGEFESVVAVGLAFDPFPPPRGAGGAGDEGRQAEFFAEVVDPAGLRARLQDDVEDGLSAEYLAEYFVCGANSAALLNLPMSMARIVVDIACS